MNKKDKNHCFYGASLLSPVTIFLNENDYITPHLKPSNDVSLHRDKIQTAYYHLQGKGLDGLAPVTFLYLHSYLLHSKLTCLLVPWPQAWCLCSYTLFYQISAWRSAFHSALSSNDSASDRPSPTTHGQSRVPQSLFSHVLTFISSKPLSVWSQLICLHVNYLSWPTRTLRSVNSKTQFVHYAALSPLPKPAP